MRLSNITIELRFEGFGVQPAPFVAAGQSIAFTPRVVVQVPSLDAPPSSAVTDMARVRWFNAQRSTFDRMSHVRLLRADGTVVVEGQIFSNQPPVQLGADVDFQVDET